MRIEADPLRQSQAISNLTKTKKSKYQMKSKCLNAKTLNQ